MSRILISINPEHVENILNGSKKYEYRKVSCRSDVDRLIIYSTYPIVKVVAEVEITRILEDEPEVIWKKTKDYAGISKRFFDNYYKGRSKAVAFEIDKITIFQDSKSLEDYGVKSPPQSFVYV